MVYLIWHIYKWSKTKVWLDNFIRVIAKSSYEIYLVQMIVFVFMGSIFNFIDNIFIRVTLYMLFTTTLSLILGIGFKKYLIDKCSLLQS